MDMTTAAEIAKGLKYIGVGLSTIAMMGAAIGVGKIFSSLIEGISRNPETESKLIKGAFIGAALAEAMGIFAFLLALLLLFVA